MNASDEGYWVELERNNRHIGITTFKVPACTKCL